MDGPMADKIIFKLGSLPYLVFDAEKGSMIYWRSSE